jgi:hypothetical protein
MIGVEKGIIGVKFDGSRKRITAREHLSFSVCVI